MKIRAAVVVSILIALPLVAQEKSEAAASSSSESRQSPARAVSQARPELRPVTNGTQDHLAKFDASGSATIDSGIVEASDGNIGIGTTSPTQRFHLWEDADISTVLKVENPNVGPSAAAVFRTQSDSSSTSYVAHGSGRNLTRFGIPNLAGWGEIVNFQGNGFVMGVTGPKALILGTNNQDRVHITAEGNVGIGTNAPITTLEVAGPIKGNRHLAFMPWTNAANVPKVGYVRLKTPITDQESNMFSLHILGYRYLSLPQAIDIRCSGYAYTGNGLVNHACTTSGTDLPVEVTTEPSGSTNYVVIRIGTLSTYWNYPHFSVEYDGWVAHDPAGFVWSVESAVPTGAPPLTNMNNVAIVNQGGGSVVIGQPTYTGTRLTVHGDAIFNGTLTATKVIGAVYQDLAEWVPAATDMVPGTVVVLNPEKSNEVMASSHAYDTMVAGVVSAQPGIVLGSAGDSKEQVATTGRVRVHVDATAVPIRIGDLLVTGTLPGTAMKSIPVEVSGIAMHRPGTIIGKALEPLEGGVGEILVLLSLQ